MLETFEDRPGTSLGAHLKVSSRSAAEAAREMNLSNSFFAGCLPGAAQREARYSTP